MISAHRLKCRRAQEICARARDLKNEESGQRRCPERVCVRRPRSLRWKTERSARKALWCWRLESAPASQRAGAGGWRICAKSQERTLEAKTRAPPKRTTTILGEGKPGTPPRKISRNPSLLFSFDSLQATILLKVGLPRPEPRWLNLAGQSTQADN